jgi:hypothetical protein
MPTIEELQTELVKSDEALRGDMAQLKKALDDEKTHRETMKAKGFTPEGLAEIAKRIDTLDKAISDKNTAMGEIQSELVKKLEEANKLGADTQARLDEIEKASQRPGGFGQGGEVQKTAGEQLIELAASEENQKLFQDFAAKRVRSGQLPMVTMKSFEGQLGFSGLNQMDIVKALSSGMTTGLNPASNFIPVQQLPGYIPIQRRRLRMRDLIPIVPTQAPYIRYLRQTGFTTVGTSSITGITRTGSTATVTQAGHGYTDFDLVKIAGATGATAGFNGNWRIKVTGANTYTYDLGALTPDTPATGTLTVKRMNNWGAAAFVAEGGLKSEAEMSFEERDARVEVIAHYIKAHRQVLDDLPGLRANVDNDLLYGLLFREDAALLYGSGVSPTIPGIMLDPDTQSYAWSQGATGDTKADALRRSRTLVELALYEASAAVIHPLVWEEIELEKGSDGHYLWVQGPAGLNPAGESMWRVPLVISPAMRYEQFLIGAFGAAATLYDREQANIRFSDQNEDDFIRNRVTILAEERLGVAWKRPEAFVVGSYDTAPA